MRWRQAGGHVTAASVLMTNYDPDGKARSFESLSSSAS